MKRIWIVLVVVAFGFGFACGDDDANEADQAGIGAQCTNDEACEAYCVDDDDDGVCDVPADVTQCLTNFTGGYCGKKGCSDTVGCPSGSACVEHSDGSNYCFRTCAEKTECNTNRSEENAANCVGNITFVDPDQPGKACVPPSSGI